MTTKNISFIPFHLEVSIAEKKSSCLNRFEIVLLVDLVDKEKVEKITMTCLRITEAICFDFNLEHQQSEYKGLYLLRGKRQKDRWIYVSPVSLKGRGLKQRLVEITEHIPRINKFILIKEENLIPKQDN
ncbi:hypothetical protein Glove_574g12 [Diversispora epigaea]|uniref:Uncharacterized protein n=1 Tax=Diversispora epigaea TaxID=1348612 RepID=A0A397G9J0_9GLOM|nr:hypothetical protein Glove_574g12 [Diversispora epigaea]